MPHKGKGVYFENRCELFLSILLYYRFFQDLLSRECKRRVAPSCVCANNEKTLKEDYSSKPKQSMKQKCKSMKCGVQPGNQPTNRTLKDLISEYLKTWNNQKCNNSSYTMCDDFKEARELYNDPVDKFLERCVCNRRRHQTRLSKKAVEKAVEKLMQANVLNKQFNNFEELYDFIYDRIGKGSTGISYSTVYDTAARMGYSFPSKVLPKDYVYVHRKLVESTKHILGKKSIIEENRRIKRDLFIKEDSAFSNLNALQIEDFLCIYHDSIVK